LSAISVNKAVTSRRRFPQRRVSTPYNAVELAGVVARNIFGPTGRFGPSPPFLAPDSRWSHGDTDTIIAFTGDWMPARGRRIRFEDGLKRFLCGVDLLVANFEGVSLPPPRAVVMQQVHGEETFSALTELAPPRRIVLSCANNHSADHGFDLFCEHVRNLESRGFAVVGSRERPFIEPFSGLRLAAVTQWSNHAGSFLAGLETEADRVRDGLFQVLFPHWGYELELSPRPILVEKAREWLSRWDLVIGHHSHTPAPVTVLESPGGPRPVAFSLGNFICCSRRRLNSWGIVVRIFLGKERTGNYRLRRLEWRFSRSRLCGREIRVGLADACPYFPRAAMP
jgi:hypothetical protein